MTNKKRSSAAILAHPDATHGERPRVDSVGNSTVEDGEPNRSHVLGACIDALRPLPPTIRILPRHLASVVRETELAANAIGTNLVDAHHQFEELLRQARAIGDAAQGPAATLDALETDINSGSPQIDGYLARQVRRVESDAKQWASVASAATSLADVIAKLRDGGKSSELTELECRARDRCEAIRANCDERAKLAHREWDSDRSALAELRQMASARARAREDHVARIERIAAQAEHVSKRLVDALSLLQFQDIARQRIEQVVRTIGQIESHVGSILAYAADSSAPALDSTSVHAESMRGEYVMNGQRLDHENSGDDSSTEGDLPKIELF